MRKFFISSLVSAALVVGQAGVAQAQCNVASTVSMTFGATKAVYKILTAPALCQTTMMNALFCSPTGSAMNTNFLLASAMGTATPSCAWSCTCSGGGAPHVVIDGSDGLPVELMEFGLE